MNSQGTPSTEVSSLISDVTDPDEISDDINTYFQSVTLPETEKTVYKCSFCEKTWESCLEKVRTEFLFGRKWRRQNAKKRNRIVVKKSPLSLDIFQNRAVRERFFCFVWRPSKDRTK